MKGAEVVFHTASPFFTAGYSDAQAELVDPAVQGTENVLNEAIAAGIKRIVLTSSVAAVTDSKNYVPPEDKVFDESDWNDVSTLETNPYSLSKTLAERYVFLLFACLNCSPVSTNSCGKGGVGHRRGGRGREDDEY